MVETDLIDLERMLIYRERGSNTRRQVARDIWCGRASAYARLVPVKFYLSRMLRWI